MPSYLPVENLATYLSQFRDEGICSEFRDYFEKAITQKLRLSSAQSDTYLADFPHLAVTESAKCDSRITEEEVRQALETVGTNKYPRD